MLIHKMYAMQPKDSMDSDALHASRSADSAKTQLQDALEEALNHRDAAQLRAVLRLIATTDSLTFADRQSCYRLLPYRLELIPDWEDGGYAARYPQLVGCITCAETLDGALRNALDAEASWLEAAIRNDVPIPFPDTIPA